MRERVHAETGIFSAVILSVLRSEASEILLLATCNEATIPNKRLSITRIQVLEGSGSNVEHVIWTWCVIEAWTPFHSEI